LAVKNPTSCKNWRWVMWEW